MNPETIEEVIGQAIGEASMCWEEYPSSVFDSTKASKIVDRVVEYVKQAEINARNEAITECQKAFNNWCNGKRDWNV